MLSFEGAKTAMKSFAKRAEALARTPLGRVAVGAAGLAIVAVVLHHADPERVWASLRRGWAVVPILFALEGLYNALELLALRDLYGEDRRKIPLSELFRAGLVAFALGGVMPMGRPVVESVRGVALSRWASGARAAAAGTRLQYLLLISQALLCVPCAIAALVLPAPPILLLALVGNGVVTGAMGVGLYIATRRGTIARRLPKLGERAASFAPAFDRHLREETLRPRAVLLVLLGRAVQVVQFTAVLAVFIGGFEPLRGLGIVGVQMVGATIGDLIPTHVGGTEALAPIGAETLSLPLSDALAIPLLVHAVQAAWIVVGFFAHALWRPKEPAAVAELA
jgi:hypothetical protein